MQVILSPLKKLFPNFCKMYKRGWYTGKYYFRCETDLLSFIFKTARVRAVLNVLVIKKRGNISLLCISARMHMVENNEKCLKTIKKVFFMLVLLVEYIFLTTFYVLYFYHQLQITLYNLFKLLRTKLYSLTLLRVHAHYYAQGLGVAYQPYARAPTA